VILKGGCNFVVETDRSTGVNLENGGGVEVYLTISLMKHKSEKN
jgi:hypothetical protein